MALTARGSDARIAFGKQSGVGTAQATPAFEYGIHGGSLKPTNVEVESDVLDASDTPPGYEITYADGIGDPTLVVDAASIGLILFSHLGADSVATGPPKVHTLSRSRAKAFLTGYGLRPEVGTTTGKWGRALDLFPKMVEFQATKGNFLRAATQMIGTNYRFPVSAPSPTADTRIPTGAQRLTFVGATVAIDLAATPATTSVHNIDTANVRSEYPNAVWQQTDALNPSYLDLGEYRAGFTAEGYLENYSLLSGTYLGTYTVTTDSDTSAIVTTGSAKFTYQIGPTSSANSILVISLPSQRITVTPMEPDLGGGAVRVSMTGKVLTPASGEPVIWTLTNSTASY